MIRFCRFSLFFCAISVAFGTARKQQASLFEAPPIGKLQVSHFPVQQAARSEGLLKTSFLLRFLCFLSALSLLRSPLALQISGLPLLSALLPVHSVFSVASPRLRSRLQFGGYVQPAVVGASPTKVGVSYPFRSEPNSSRITDAELTILMEARLMRGGLKDYLSE